MAKQRRQFFSIDDSGNPRRISGSKSQNLVMAAAMFNNSKEIDKLVGIFNGLRSKYHWPMEREFKFQAMRKDLIIDTLNAVMDCSFKIYAVVANSEKFEKGYYKKVLCELVHFLPLNDYDRINIDGDLDKKEQRKIKPYLRKGLKAKSVGITFSDSKKDNIIQLADLIVGATARYFSDTKSDSKVYFNLIKDRIIEIKYL